MVVSPKREDVEREIVGEGERGESTSISSYDSIYRFLRSPSPHRRLTLISLLCVILHYDYSRRARPLFSPSRKVQLLRVTPAISCCNDMVLLNCDPLPMSYGYDRDENSIKAVRCPPNGALRICSFD